MTKQGQTCPRYSTSGTFEILSSTSYYRMKEIVKEKELVIVGDGKGLFMSFIFKVLQLDAGNKEVLKLKKFLDGKVKEHKTATAKAMSKMFKK